MARIGRKQLEPHGSRVEILPDPVEVSRPIRVDVIGEPDEAIVVGGRQGVEEVFLGDAVDGRIVPGIAKVRPDVLGGVADEEALIHAGVVHLVEQQLGRHRMPGVVHPNTALHPMRLLEDVDLSVDDHSCLISRACARQRRPPRPCPQSTQIARRLAAWWRRLPKEVGAVREPPIRHESSLPRFDRTGFRLPPE